MKYKGLKYTKEFEFHIGKEWLGTDVEIEEGDDLDEVFRQVKAKVHQLVTGSNPESQPTQQAPPREIKVEKEPVEERVKRIMDDINSCVEVKVLESYRLIAKQHHCLQQAYDLKLKELTDANK